MVHVRELKRPAKGKETTGGGLDSAEDFYSLFIPVKTPAEESGGDDDEKTVGDKDDKGESLFEAFF